MVSLCRQKDQRPKFPADKVIRFFRTILEEEETHLKVPRWFVKKHKEKYGKQLSEVVHLKLPSGAQWDVEVSEKNGHFWFEKGWEKFSKFYLLQAKDKLWFQYEGNNRFEVNISDYISSGEIDYPMADSNMQENHVNDHSPPASPPLAQTNKEATPNAGKHDLSVGKNEGHKSNPQRSRQPIAEAMRMPSSSGGNATAPVSPSFLVTMHSTYLKKGYLWLPRELLQICLVKQPANATLEVLGGKKPWPVKLKYTETEGRVKFQCGWSDFVRDQKLKVGDECEFVLVDTDRLVFEVKIRTANHTFSPDINDGDHEEDEHENEDLNHIPRHLKRREKSPLASPLCKKTRPTSITQKFPEDIPEIPRKMHHPDTYTASSGKDIALEKANPCPYFKVVIRPSFIHGCYLLVPVKFAKRYLVEQPSRAILQVAGKRPCSVNFHYAAGKTTFQRGWFEFVQDNELKEGDACVFKLTDNIKFLFDVVFNRST